MEFTLTNASLTAAVRALGGELVSLRDLAGTEYIWQGDPAFWSGQNPILFPIVGQPERRQSGHRRPVFRDGPPRLCPAQRVCPRGTGRGLYRPGAPGEPGDPGPLPLPLCPPGPAPAPGNGFSTAFTVENPGPGPLPFCVGAHTAIRCPLQPGERFEDCELLFDEPERADSHLLSPQGIILHDGRRPMLDGSRMALDYRTFEEMDTVIFSMLRSGKVSLLHRETGQGVQLDFHEFPMVAFWTKPGAPYLCMEPWQGCAAWDNESGNSRISPSVSPWSPAGRSP